MFVDVFEGALSGLIMAEAEFESPEDMDNYGMPDFAYQEVTEDVRYTGGYLVTDGLPKVG